MSRLRPRQILEEVRIVKENKRKFDEVEKKYRPRSITEIAKKHKKSRQAIYNIIKRHGDKDKKTKEEVSTDKV